MKLVMFMAMVFLISICSVLAIDITEQSLAGTDSIDGRRNELLDSNDTKLGLLIPAILLVVTIVCFSIDFGAAGVAGASAMSLVLLYFLHIVYLNPVSLISFVIIVAILVYKLSR